MTITTDPERRDFLKTLARTGFYVGIAGGLPLLDVSRAKAAPVPQILSEGLGTTPAELVRSALLKQGGMEAFVKPGDVVVIKPNIGWDRTPEEAANTNPELVRELALMAREAGADEVHVFDRSANDARRCYKRSGIEDALKILRDSQIRVSHMADIRYEVVQIQGAQELDKWPLYRPALEADVLINVPILKHHGLSGITVGMKNLMGIMGGNRGRIHKKLDDSLVDLNFAVRSHLTVVDATRILTANGPQGGGTANVKELGLVAACTDVVTADAWGAKVFGRDPMSVGHIRRAHERGLGIADLSQVTTL